MIQKILSLQEISSCFTLPSCSADWTAVIPAAGKGSRLGFDQPKILYPVLGRAILDWQIELLRPYCSKMVWVVSPSGHELISNYLKQYHAELNFELVTQLEPTGMGDAVALAEAKVHSPHVLIVWGDQVAFRTQTIARCLYAHEIRDKAELTLPTVIKSQPYINFRRNSTGRIIDVFQAREGGVRPQAGESDCGLFLCTSAHLFPKLKKARDQGRLRGHGTGENNFLPLIPDFEGESGEVITVRIDDFSEGLGINTLEEAKEVEALLKERQNGVAFDRQA